MKSLQDQLLNTGLIDKNKAKQVVKEKQKSAKAARKAKGKKPGTEENSGNAMRARHAGRDRELNRQRQIENEKKAISAQIKQLVAMNRVDPGDAQISYNFVYQKKIKKLEISGAVRDQLLLGRLAIVALEENRITRFELVPRVVAEKIAQRDNTIVVQMDQSGTEPADDDPYAGFEVPDDLMW